MVITEGPPQGDPGDPAMTDPIQPIHTFPTKVARLAWVKAQLGTNPKWALRGLAIIAARQTAAEVQTETTSEDNGVGFTGLDAQILTSFAKQVAKWEATPPAHRYAEPLSPKQMTLLLKKMAKYATQVIDANLAAFDAKYPIVHVKKGGNGQVAA